MEDTIKKLIRLNVELEGVLRVAFDRPCAEAMDAARDKFAEMSALFAGLGKAPVCEKAPVADEPLKVAPEPEKKAPLAPLDPAPAPESATTAAPPAAAPRGDIRRMLTLNDKFLFRRELFNGSDTELNDTLDLVASMASMREAEEYLYDDLQLDPDSDSMRQFIEILGSYFNTSSR